MRNIELAHLKKKKKNWPFWIFSYGTFTMLFMPLFLDYHILRAHTIPTHGVYQPYIIHC